MVRAVAQHLTARRLRQLLASALIAQAGAAGACRSQPAEVLPRPLPLSVISAPLPAPVEPAPPAQPEPVVPELPVAADARFAAAARAAQEAEAFRKRFPLHGQAFHVLAQIFAAPEAGAPVLGYMRRGARFRASEGTRGSGCDTRWHELATGGFVCRGRGFIVADTAPDFRPAPAPPRLSDRLPYAYLKTVSSQVPQYWRIPTAVEETAAQTALAEIAADLALQAQTESEAQFDGVSTPLADAPGEAGGPSPAEAEIAGPEGGGRDPRLPDYVRMGMERGFYISHANQPLPDASAATSTALGQEDATQTLERARGHEFVRSVRGAYVRGDKLVPGDSPTLHGHRLDAQLSLPLGLVYFGTTQALRRQAVGDAYTPDGELARFEALTLVGQAERIGRFQYQLARDGRWVQTRALRIARKRERPPLVPRGGRWLHIDLAEQVLVAYEGDTPVYATLVSTGKPGFETPTGIYRIQAKHVATTMDGAENTDESYSIEDVPWTMYFQGSYALHAAFWHERFGRVRSHGCVNLAPADARHLFEWTTPTLPEGWHGVLTQTREHSTYVVID